MTGVTHHLNQHRHLTVELGRGTVAAVDDLTEIARRRRDAGHTILPDTSRSAIYKVLYDRYLSLQRAVHGLTSTGEQKVDLGEGRG